MIKNGRKKKFICEICWKELDNLSLKANHIRWEHKTSIEQRFSHSQKWYEAMHNRKHIVQNKSYGLYVCQFCKKEWNTTKEGHSKHEKYCVDNPNKSIHKSHAQTEETKKKLSEKALNNDYRRIMRHIREYNGFLCDSSWEVKMIQKFEEINEPFIKPKPITYIDDNGKQHHYFPDFFLPNRNLIVEVKNPYLFKNDRKVQILKEMRQDIIWITSLKDIENFKLD